MATLFVRHDVMDFATWKRAYDDLGAERSTMGVTGHGAYQVEDNPNSVIIYHHFSHIRQIVERLSRRAPISLGKRSSLIASLPVLHAEALAPLLTMMRARFGRLPSLKWTCCLLRGYTVQYLYIFVHIYIYIVKNHVLDVVLFNVGTTTWPRPLLSCACVSVCVSDSVLPDCVVWLK